jgi:hypothetical protein
MNDRIKQLARESGLLVHNPNGVPTKLEKFAELIVLECVKVLTQHGTYFSGEGEPYHYAASLIEEHFGVE